jgi:hypothetical protein
MITLLGEYPSLTIGPLLDNYQHDVEAIMRESLESEAKALTLYRELLKCAEGHSVVIEEYARQMVYAEELHASEVDKMLRKPCRQPHCSRPLSDFGPCRALSRPPRCHAARDASDRLGEYAIAATAFLR